MDCRHCWFPTTCPMQDGRQVLVKWEGSSLLSWNVPNEAPTSCRWWRPSLFTTRRVAAALVALVPARGVEPTTPSVMSRAYVRRTVRACFPMSLVTGQPRQQSREQVTKHGPSLTVAICRRERAAEETDYTPHHRKSMKGLYSRIVRALRIPSSAEFHFRLTTLRKWPRPVQGLFTLGKNRWNMLVSQRREG